jgi:D-alanine-D-alanine ligase
MSKPSIRTIGITFNLKKYDANDDRYEEYDEVATIVALKNEIERYGFKVVLFEQDKNLCRRIIANKPDFVLNIAEGIGNSRGRESQVPCILESLGIPYSGSDPVALGTTLDKYLTNFILKSSGIPVPLMFLASNVADAERLRHIFRLKRSFIVKPRWEGSSKGIFSSSLVKNIPELKRQVSFIIQRYMQPALIEEFLEKDEITVGVAGDKKPYLLGMMRICPKQASKFFIYSIETKRNWQSAVEYQPQQMILKKIQNKIEASALAAFRILELRDIARIDFRLDSNTTPKIIDINPLPGLSPHYSDLPIMYTLKGKTYSELIKTLLRESLRRYGFSL